MTILFFVLPLTLLLSSAAVLAFVWATRGGQFDDLTTPAIRALHEPIDEPRQGERRHPSLQEREAR